MSTDSTQIAQLTNSKLSFNTNVTDAEIEDTICYNLTTRVLPDNLIYNTPDSSLKIVRDNDVTGSNLIGKTLILNNEALITSELFGMKIDYIERNDLFSPDEVSLDIGDITNTIYLDSATESLFDSNLKIEIEFNNDQQFTDENVNNTGIWGLNMTRQDSNRTVNTFAAVNSLYNRINGDSPFYIQEESTNNTSLGNDTSKWFSLDNSSSGDQKIISNNISNNYKLNTNFMTGTIDNASDYNFSDFNMYKLTQDTPTITAEVSQDMDFTNLPFQYVNGGSVSEINSNTFNFSGAILDTTGVGSGFTLQLTATSGGGYDYDENDLFSIDDSNLTRNASNPYMSLTNLENLDHTVEITNGSVTITGNSNNTDYIDIDSTIAETLNVNDYNSNGLITIVVDTSDNRVYYPQGDGSNTSGSYGFKNGSITDKVIVTYPGEGPVSISNNLLTEPNVNCNINVLAPSTTYTNLAEFTNADSRNVDYNNKTILTVVYPNDTYNNNTRVSNIGLTSYISDNSNINIISVHNESILTEDTPLLDSSNNSVANTKATAKMINLELSASSAYSEFKIQLNTKTISELSTALGQNNTWTLQNPNDYLIGDANKVGIINDSYLFMTSESTDNNPIAVNYEFIIANPDCGNISSIKRAIKATFNDIVDNGINDDILSGSTYTTSYIDHQDIQFLDNKMIEFNIQKESDITSSTHNINNYVITKKIQLRSYYSTFDPKIQFYTNVTFQTPRIVERITYYTISDNGIEKPFLLKYFKLNSGKNLANVQVEFLDFNSLSTTAKNCIMNETDDSSIHNEIINKESTQYTTLISYSKSACSIFKASIWGKHVENGVFTMLGDYIDIDPFFKQTGTLSNFLDGPTIESSDLLVQFSSSVEVSGSVYYINLTNQPGVNQSFKAKIYRYTDYNSSNLENYSPFHNYYVEDYMTSAYIDVSNVNGDLDLAIQLRVYEDSAHTNLLAIIDSSSTLVNSYNIISIPETFFKVNYTVGQQPTITTRLLGSNKKLGIDNGIVYYYKSITNSEIGQSETFNLVTDSFTAQFVDNNNYVNSNNLYTSQTKFTSNNINTWLGSHNVRSIKFDRLRGYQYVNGGDEIVIDRTTNKTTGQFKLQLNDNYYAIQQITDIYNGQQVTLNNVSYNGTTYSLGLVLNFNESMLGSNDTTNYKIDVSIANYSASVIANPYNTDILGQISSGNLITNQSTLISKYFENVKPATIKSQNISLTITFDVPNATLYAGNNTYIGNPESNNNWTSSNNYTHNNLLNNNNCYVINAFKLNRNTSKNVFYNSFTSYFVISPPVISVYAVTDFSNIEQLSQISNLQPQYIASFHINHYTNMYICSPMCSNTNTVNLTFSEANIKPYNQYTSYNGNNKYFRIEGNFVTIKLYMNGVGSGNIDNPRNVDATENNYIQTLFDRQIMTNLINRDYDDVHIDVSFNNFINNISYSQYLLALNMYHSTKNIIFSLGNPFSPKISTSKYYLRLPANKGSIVSFYQSTLQYYDGYYYINIDKYETGAVTDYSSLLSDPSSNIDFNKLVTNNTVNEVLFPIFKRSTKTIDIDPSNIIDSNTGIIKPVNDILSTININNISQSTWSVDASFSLQYSGITLSAITVQGRNNIRSLFEYDYTKYLDSKSLYIYLPDVIHINNILGNTIYRVTNGGNVHAPRLSTSNISLFSNPYNDNQVAGINGSGDIQSIFINNSLLNDHY